MKNKIVWICLVFLAFLCVCVGAILLIIGAVSNMGIVPALVCLGVGIIIYFVLAIGLVVVLVKRKNKVNV